VVRPIIEAKRKPAQTPARAANKAKGTANGKRPPASAAKARPRPAAPLRAAPPPAPVPVVPLEAAPAVRTLAVDAEYDGQRLDNFLLRELKGVPKTHVYRIIRSGEVRVNKGRASADTKLAGGDLVRVPPVRMAAPATPAEAAPPREFPILFEDEHLIAIDKPSGTAVHGGSGVSFGVIEQLRRARPGQKYLELVHRLDRETSGILLLAKKRGALVALQEQFRARETGKTYAALVVGRWPAKLKVIDVALHKTGDGGGERRVYPVAADHPDGQRSISLVRIAREFAATTLLDVTIKTGRTHQIRVHLQHSGHVIVGDDKYGDFALNRRYARGEAVPGVRFERMFLHARQLAFELVAPLPPECAALVAALARQTEKP
jgi:23S rRNA pseudouridine955/2504/2580 synthase